MAKSSLAAKVIKELCSQTAPPQSILVLASDSVRRQRVCNVLRDHFEKQGQRIELRRFSASSLSTQSIEALADEILTPTLFSAWRFFIIENSESMRATEYRALLALLERGPEKATLILAGQTVPKNSVLYRYFHEQGRLVVFDDLKGAELRAWIKKELKQQSLNVYPEPLVDRLMQAGSGSLDTLALMIERLALYAGEAEVSLDDLSMLFPDEIDINEFELVSALDQRPGRAECLLQQLIAGGKSPFPLLALVARNYSAALSIAALTRQGLNRSELLSRLGVPAWLLDKQAVVATNFTPEQLVKKHCKILRADSKLKNRSVGADAILADLVR